MKINKIFGSIVTDKNIIVKINSYNEFSIREVAEEYYKKPFNKLLNVEANKLYDWGCPVGKEIW